MNRRGFLGSILLAAAAPAIVRADSLMRIVPRDVVLLGDYALDARGSGHLIYATDPASPLGDRCVTSVMVLRPDGRYDLIDMIEHLGPPLPPDAFVVGWQRRVQEVLR
jgi:hypothetical protein